MSGSNSLVRLQYLLSFSEEPGSLDENLRRLAQTAANVLGAGHCSIMLLSDGPSEDSQLRVCATFGRELPQQAYTESVGQEEGIAGQVFRRGEPILVEDIELSEFAGLARYPGLGNASLVCAPIVVNGNVVGVINIDSPQHHGPFTEEDLQWLGVAGLFIGKSIQVMQLQNLLNSRFAQMALSQETEKTLARALANPDLVARILAKSFFKEMTGAGFGSRQIINAASEIISLLSKQLQKHSERIGNDLS